MLAMITFPASTSAIPDTATTREKSVFYVVDGPGATALFAV